MEELKTILRDSPMLSVRERDEGKPGSPYTYLHGSSGNGNRRSDGRQDDGNPNRTFSTFKPPSDASRSGARFSDGTSIQQPSCVDSSSPIRADANTNRLPGVRAHTHASGGSWQRLELLIQEKAVYGVPMPRSYLELTLSAKSNEVDNASTANFSGDVLLIPDLSPSGSYPGRSRQRG
ncbi:hypothetical protein KUCAC02_032066 [Chaenocephalus aceratus]|nr:hypothetical protein KUCAC02_032066 [Chaenocephalus aceratus]